ncbi:MAG: hypothetical protein MUO36_01020, partial [Candidatus Hadarchaeum sp.]|nr:hypothetical protein [Candidatus Hadarchaeum sp.]
NARMMLRVLRGETGPQRDIVVLNAAAAIVIGGKARTMLEGIAIAKISIDSRKAYEKVVQLIEATGGDMQKLKALEASM